MKPGCARAAADAWISNGRVTINGKRAELGTQVTAADEVRVDNPMVGTRKKKKVYICFNKPAGITCTTERDVRDNIIDFIEHEERIFPIGRLDKESEGLVERRRSSYNTVRSFQLRQLWVNL